MIKTVLNEMLGIRYPIIGEMMADAMSIHQRLAEL